MLESKSKGQNGSSAASEGAGERLANRFQTCMLYGERTC